MDDPNENNNLNESIVSCGKFIETSSSSEVANGLDDNCGVQINLTKCLSKNDSLYPVNLSWHGLSYVVKKRFKKEYVTILKNVTGETRAGELTALLGPSGAGKTTLLNILVGGIKKGVSGKVVVNGKERKQSTFQHLICYTQQHGEVISDLSLRETLTVAANLKLDRRITREEKCKIVKDALHFWGLYDSKDTMVQKLSGGEKKRLSVAQEVINKPSLVFLDEPTSGLDSLSCVKCVSLLKNLAQQGHNVICSIHQPTALIFEKFDRVCFLSDGECLYNGPRYNLLPHLSRCGLECPLHHNPADFVIEIALGEYGEGNAEKLIVLNDQNYKELQDKMDDYELKCNSSLKNKSVYNKDEMRNDINKTCTVALLPDNKVENYSEKYPTSFGNQFLVLFGRATMGVIRSWIITHVLVTSHILVALLLGLIYYDIGNDAAKIQDNASCFFFCMVFISFAAMMGTVLIFPLEMSVIRREIFNRWYQIRSYYLARTLADIPLQIILPIIFGSIVYWMTNQANDFALFVLFLSILIMVGLISQTLGLCLGALCNLQVSVFLGPVGLLLPALLFCGFFIRLSIVPSYLRWISYISIFRYSFKGLLLANYGFNRTFSKCSSDLCPSEKLDNFLEDMEVKESVFYIDFIIMLTIFLLLRVASYFVLKWKTTRVQ